jgi:hypothetical protein
MATYKGTSRIKSILDAESVDRQIRALDQFDEHYSRIMGKAVQDAAEVARAQASKNAPRLTGQLAGSTFKKYLGVNKRNMDARAAYGIDKSQGVKGLVMEVGRHYGARWWRGFFFLYYGAVDKASEIREIYASAQKELVQRLVVR